MRRDQHVLDDEALATSTREAGDMPIVDHGHRAFRHQKVPPRWRLSFLLEERTADQPLRVINTAGEAELAREPGAAGRALGAAGRCDAGGDTRFGVAPPTLFL